MHHIRNHPNFPSDHFDISIQKHIGIDRTYVTDQTLQSFQARGTLGIVLPKLKSQTPHRSSYSICVCILMQSALTEVENIHAMYG